jgi:hypothetical protein
LMHNYIYFETLEVGSSRRYNADRCVMLPLWRYGITARLATHPPCYTLRAGRNAPRRTL